MALPRICLSLVLAAAAARAAGGELVSVPWEELKGLYRESLRRELLKELPAAPRPAGAVVEEAVCRLSVGEQGAAANLTLSGRCPAGPAVPLALLGDDVVVAKVESAKGGFLAASGGGLVFHPEVAGQFQLTLALLLPVQTDGRSRLVAFRPPPAVQSRVSVELAEGLRLVSGPGIPGEAGVFHLAPGARVEVRFEKRAGPADAPPAAPPAPEIDVLTEFRMEAGGVALYGRFVPVAPVAGPLTVRPPAGARLLDSSLRSSWVRESPGGVELQLPAGFAEPFAMRWRIETRGPAGPAPLTLPAVADNVGREGYLRPVEPDDAELRFEARGLVAGIPAARLPAAFKGLLGEAETCLRVPTGESVTVSVRRFQAAAAPELTVDCLHLFTSFAESGDALSVLKVTLPASAGPRLALRPVAGAQVWSLRVNGQRRTLYAEGDRWIVPLPRGAASEVELAFLRRGEPLKLRGRLEVVVPETGLSARELRVGVALPERVDLVSVEGELSPARGEGWAAPAEFAGRRYYFTRMFHLGKTVAAALAYREPADGEGR